VKIVTGASGNLVGGVLDLLALVFEIESRETHRDGEVVYRALVALGNLVSRNSRCGREEWSFFCSPDGFVTCPCSSSYRPLLAPFLLEH
jgi:hypothetical protein